MGSFAIVAFVLLVGVAYLVARAYLSPEEPAVEEEEARSPMEVKKEQLLDAIREFDMDYETGKLSEDDYRSLRTRFVAETAEVMKALAQTPVEPVLAPVSPVAIPVASMRGESVSAATIPGELDDELEREIAARRMGLAPPSCPGCGVESSGEDAFCRKCGTSLVCSEGL